MSKIWKPDLDYGFAEVLDYGYDGSGLSYDNQGDLFFDDGSSDGTAGRPVPIDFSGLQMNVSFDPSDCRPDCFTCGVLFIVPDALKSVLDELGANAQYTRFAVSQEEGNPIDEVYYYCNCEIIDCFDFEHGDYTFFQNDGFRDKVDSIKKLAIDEGKASGHALFRIAKGGEHLICVSDALATRIADAGLRGVKFV